MTKKPSYRFTGYAEPWEEKKLRETETLFTDGNYGEAYPSEKDLTTSENGVPFLRGSNLVNGVLDETNANYITHEKHEELTSGHIELDDIILAVRGSLGAIGYAKDENVGWNINSQLAIIRTNKNEAKGDFLLQFFISTKGQRELLSRNTGTALKQLPLKQLKDIPVPLPSLPEQTAIGSFFQDIDQLISLQQCKLEVLKEQKKTYLKLLFPAKGQIKPALRFAGFEDDWKEVKLGEVGETYTGLSGKTKEDFGHGEGKFITYVNVFNNPLTDLYGLDSVEIDDKQRRVQYGDVLFTTSSETPEDVGLSSVWMGTEDNVYLNSFCFGYRPQKGIFDLYYLAFVLRSFSVRKEFMLLAQGISRFNISKTKIMDMSIYVPSLPEQEAIGSFFQDLDKAIAKQEEKVNQLKESKQTLLRKMFI